MVTHPTILFVKRRLNVKKIICDFCGAEISYYPWQAASFPQVRIKIIYDTSFEKNLDLCEFCQKAIVQNKFKIYKEEEN